MTHQIVQTWAPIVSEKIFAEAAASYIEHGDGWRFLDPIIEFLGNRPLASIYPFDVTLMAKTLFPMWRWDGGFQPWVRQQIMPQQGWEETPR